MKIAVIPPITRTGEGRYSDYLIDGIKKKGIEINVLNNHFLHRPNIRIFLGSFLIKKILNNENYILHNLDNLGPFLLRQNNTKNILTIHDISPVLFPKIHNSIIKFNFKRILPLLIKNTDLIIADSYSTKKDLEHYFKVNKEKINVIHLGVDSSFFYPRAHLKKFLNKYDLKNPYLLYLGDDNPRKNLKNLILAYNNIYKEISQDLVLAGPINQDKLKAFIKKIDKENKLSKRIITLGYVDYEDLPVLYSAASAFIFPSLYEGFGLPPLEAMACGTPVIVSKNSSIPEVVGDAGLYINNPLNPEEISKIISILLDDDKLQKIMKNKGLKRAKNFSWENTINKTLKVYEEVYNGN